MFLCSQYKNLAYKYNNLPPTKVIKFFTWVIISLGYGTIIFSASILHDNNILSNDNNHTKINIEYSALISLITVIFGNGIKDAVTFAIHSSHNYPEKLNSEARKTEKFLHGLLNFFNIILVLIIFIGMFDHYIINIILFMILMPLSTYLFVYGLEKSKEINRKKHIKLDRHLKIDNQVDKVKYLKHQIENKNKKIETYENMSVLQFALYKLLNKNK